MAEKNLTDGTAVFCAPNERGRMGKVVKLYVYMMNKGQTSN
jgi:hypothetical protein